MEKIETEEMYIVGDPSCNASAALADAMASLRIDHPVSSLGTPPLFGANHVNRSDEMVVREPTLPNEPAGSWLRKLKHTVRCKRRKHRLLIKSSGARESKLSSGSERTIEADMSYDGANITGLLQSDPNLCRSSRDLGFSEACIQTNLKSERKHH